MRLSPAIFPRESSPTEEELNTQRCVLFFHSLNAELKLAHRAEKLKHHSHGCSQRNECFQATGQHRERALIIEQHLQYFGRQSGLLYAGWMRSPKYGNGESRADMYGVDANDLEECMQIE